MILKNIMGKLKTVSFSRWLVSLVDRFCSMPLWKMVQSFTVYPSLHLYKEALMSKKFLGCDLMSWSLWNCFSYYPSVTTFDILDAQSGKFIGKDKKWYAGAYLFTVDWAHPESNIIDTDHSEIPQEHKCAHIIALENGNYAAQPNNRLIWSIPSFTVRDEIPSDWRTQSSEWNVEDIENGEQKIRDKFFYDIEEIKNDKMDKNKT